MATTAELISRMKYRLSRQDDSSLDARILAELQAAQESLEEGTTLPWFLNVTSSFEVVGAHDTFSLSEFPRFLRISEDAYALQVEDLTRTDETLVKLTRQDTYHQLLRYSAGYADETTLPEAYYVMGSLVHVRKKQVVTRKYYLSYYAKDVTAPAADNSTLWTTNLGNLLMAEAGIHVARYLRDDTSVQLFMGMKNAKMAELIRRNQALQDADQNYVMDE
jgi:hypothetical protein